MALVLATIGSALATGVSGYVQSRQAKKLAKGNDRPERSTSPYLQEKLAKAKFDANNYGYPGMSQDQAKLDRQSAAAYSNVTESGLSPAAMLAAFSGIDYNTKQVQENMGKEAALAKERAKNLYMGTLNEMDSDYQANWDYNERQKYNENAAAISALNESSMYNFQSMLQGLGQGAINYFGEDGIIGRAGDMRPPRQRSMANPNMTNPDTGDIPSQEPVWTPPSAPAPAMPQGGGYATRFNPAAFDTQGYRSKLEGIYGPMDDNFFNYLITRT